MVLTGSVLESEYPKSLARKIKIRQPVADSARSVLAVGRTGTRRPATGAGMADTDIFKPGPLDNGTTDHPTRHPLRKILVESRSSSGGIQSTASSTAVGAPLELGAGGAGSPVASRSRNTPSNGGGGGGGGVGGGSSGGGGAGAKRQPARGRSKDVLTALSVGTAAAASSQQQQQQQQQQHSSPRLPFVSTNSGRSSRGRSPSGPSIGKSASVPANLRAEAKRQQQQQQQQQPPARGILQRSSSFFEGRSLRSLLRRRSPATPAVPASPELARKSVSFSADTSFHERRARQPGPRKTALHESKVYRKGVLQDRNGCEERLPATNLPSSWESSLGGPRALLGAAQDGDDESIKRIVARANETGGLGDIELNAVDASGRTAISYLAGNGSALLLEACLSFQGADANLPDNEGNTPLHFAAQAGQTECLNILLQRCPSIEVDARNSLGFTPLMKAALQGRTKCAKILLFAGANPTLRDHGRGLRAEQWARFCGRYVCAEVIERFARHRLLEKTTSCRWGSEPELAAQVFQGKLMPIPSTAAQPPASGLKSKIRRVFRTSSGSDKSFSLVSQLTSAALCASSPVLPKPGDVSPVVKSLLRPLSVPQLRITLVTPPDIMEKTGEKCAQSANFTEKIESTMVKPPRTKKKSK